jgi:putative flippase GtrA
MPEINCNFAGVMQRFFTRMGQWIRKMIDITYPPFRKLISPQLYRYGICGGANVGLDWVLYFLTYNFILRRREVDLLIVTLSPHIATLVWIFPLVTLTGFLLQKYVTFTASALRGRTQLARYLTVVFANLLINYAGLKILVDGLDYYPTPSKMIITLLTIVCSYTGQKRFTFRTATLPSPDKAPGNGEEQPGS